MHSPIERNVLQHKNQIQVSLPFMISGQEKELVYSQRKR